MREYPHLNVKVVREHAVMMPQSLIGPNGPYHNAHSGAAHAVRFLMLPLAMKQGIMSR